MTKREFYDKADALCFAMPKVEWENYVGVYGSAEVCTPEGRVRFRGTKADVLRWLRAELKRRTAKYGKKKMDRFDLPSFYRRRTRLGKAIRRHMAITE